MTKQKLTQTKQEFQERLAILETQRESDIEERKERQTYLDTELARIANAVESLKEWFRIQLWGNGKKDGCIDDRLIKFNDRIKALERFQDGWDWKKAAVSRVIAYAIQGVVLVALLKILNLAK